MWTSKTRQFDSSELAMLESMSAAELTSALVQSDPLVALRALAEVMLNGDDGKLAALLANGDLRAHWLRYETDRGTNGRDRGYAEQLRTRSRG